MNGCIPTSRSRSRSSRSTATRPGCARRSKASPTRAPDIYNVNYTSGYYERGLLANLTPFLAAPNPYTGKPWRDNLDAQFLEKYKSGGDVATIPLDFIEVAFFYNKTLFDRLGLPPPRTWEEMLATAHKITAGGTIIPFAVPGDTDSYWSGYGRLDLPLLHRRLSARRRAAGDVAAR